MDKLLNDAARISSLEIQGSTNIALSALEFLSNYVKRLEENKTPDKYLIKLITAKEILFNTRPIEPAMRNGLNYVIRNLETSNQSTNKEIY